MYDVYFGDGEGMYKTHNRKKIEAIQRVLSGFDSPFISEISAAIGLLTFARMCEAQWRFRLRGPYLYR